ncbi:histidinol-phosphatase HisJ [Eubacteriaceae bacterium ES3]|nr:histidinol-phosphatase HisJ [Eubacteriaceae bacterium ES3]
MIQANYHIHSNFCDGKNSLEEMVLAAIKAGLRSIGLTGHMPLPFENDWTIQEENLTAYFAEVERLINLYKDQIEIYKSLEVDYFMDRKSISQQAKGLLKDLDYVIMSIHTIKTVNADVIGYIDESRENFANAITNFYAGDFKSFIQEYYQAIGDMVTTYQPEILGHLDLIKKFNQNQCFFDDRDDWYQDIVKVCLDRIAKTKTMIEINTGADMRVPGVGRYPSDWIIPEMKNRNIPITIGGDTHFDNGIVFGFEAAENYLLNCGYTEYWMLKKGRWEAQPLGV